MKTHKILFPIILSLLLLVGSTLLLSQHTVKSEHKPKKIEGIAKEDKPLHYYLEQSKLWQVLIIENPKNAEAWHQYYKAERAALQLQYREPWVNDKPAFYKKLSPILERAEKHISDQFEYHYMLGMNAEKKEAMKALKQAYSIDPERSETYGWLFTYNIPEFNEKECVDLAKRMLKANTYSDANLKWNYNALQSIDQGGLIISNGDMDGLPKWVLQYGAGVRQDVLVVSKWFLADMDDYREKVYSKLNLELPDLKKSDFETLALYADYLAVDLLKRTNQSAYISAGTSLQFFKDNQIEDKMYLVGNVLKYSEEPFDNTAVIEENLENKYYMQYLLQNFQHHHEDEVVKSRMNLTYLPSLVHLKNHYAKTQQEEKLAYCDQLIDRIAMDSGNEEEVLEWFKQ